MQSMVIEVPTEGVELLLRLRRGATSGQVVLVLSEDVELSNALLHPGGKSGGVRVYENETGFPPRRLIEETIVHILRENGGKVKIRDSRNGWNIYDEVAARLGVSIEARQRPTPATGEPAWRPEVGFARKNLEQAGVIVPTRVSGRGIWQLAEAIDQNKAGRCPHCSKEIRVFQQAGFWDGLTEDGRLTGGALYRAICACCGAQLCSSGPYDADAQLLVWKNDYD